jgi:hypothetical protein
MSINYYGVATADRERIGPLVEGTAQPGVPPLDVAALYRTLTTRTPLRGPENATLRWEDDEGGYVFVDLSPTCVLVTQGTGGSDYGVDVIIDVTSALQDAGVNVYDPQQGSWFPGSPVKSPEPKKAKPAPKSKVKAKAKAKLKAKPKAKPKVTTKARAKSSNRKTRRK